VQPRQVSRPPKGIGETPESDFDCRLGLGEIWEDHERGHRVGFGDATDPVFVRGLVAGHSPTLAVHDPPYNVALFQRRAAASYVDWCKKWVDLTYNVLNEDSAMYIWMGADQKRHFQPLPQFLAMMAETGFQSRSLITLRNQRGYGTQKNWMAVRQELLHYIKGSPGFQVQYTDIPKILRGYYRDVGGKRTENLERSHSPNIRPGNVWVDIQQVFYRMEENVPPCPAQKPLKAIERVIRSSSFKGDTVVDFFSHAGTTLLASELNNRVCLTCDNEPNFVELTIRRLERFRSSGKTGWQMRNPATIQTLSSGDSPKPSR